MRLSVRIMRLKVRIMRLRVLVMRFSVRIMPLRVLVMPLVVHPHDAWVAERLQRAAANGTAASQLGTGPQRG
jgi:hypothetical protein